MFENMKTCLDFYQTDPKTLPSKIKKMWLESMLATVTQKDYILLHWKQFLTYVLSASNSWNHIQFSQEERNELWLITVSFHTYLRELKLFYKEHIKAWNQHILLIFKHIIANSDFHVLVKGIRRIFFFRKTNQIEGEKYKSRCHCVA